MTVIRSAMIVEKWFSQTVIIIALDCNTQSFSVILCFQRNYYKCNVIVVQYEARRQSVIRRIRDSRKGYAFSQAAVTQTRTMQYSLK